MLKSPRTWRRYFFIAFFAALILQLGSYWMLGQQRIRMLTEELLPEEYDRSLFILLENSDLQSLSASEVEDLVAAQKLIGRTIYRKLADVPDSKKEFVDIDGQKQLSRLKNGFQLSIKRYEKSPFYVRLHIIFWRHSLNSWEKDATYIFILGKWFQIRLQGAIS
jgi:hypothetical protein